MHIENTVYRSNKKTVLQKIIVLWLFLLKVIIIEFKKKNRIRNIYWCFIRSYLRGHDIYFLIWWEKHWLGTNILNNIFLQKLIPFILIVFKFPLFWLFLNSLYFDCFFIWLRLFFFSSLLFHIFSITHHIICIIFAIYHLVYLKFEFSNHFIVTLI